jgi:hypothetical protein
MADMLPYRRSALADRCRWAIPDADGYCIRCGWRAVYVVTLRANGFTFGYWRHRRPKHNRKTTLCPRTLDVPGPHYCTETLDTSSDKVRSRACSCGWLAIGRRISVPLTLAAYREWKAARS